MSRFKQLLCVLCTLAFVCTGSGLVSAETTAIPSVAEQSSITAPTGAFSGMQAFRPPTSGHFSPAVQLARKCQRDGTRCTKNSQCCSGNCQKGTDMPSGTCLHGD